MKNKIYFIVASVIWPVGNAGAVVIAKNSKEAKLLINSLGLDNPQPPKAIGTTNRATGVVFYNSTQY